ncbi:MAG: heme ABC exporter ATP-binding protein CcmA [Proteobacteria bacterium]|nr:heme ABC exporter ATP-binding protein CcmA [Pseudomonadota bacterium]
MRLVGSGLVCERGGRTVFTGLDFAVASGELVALTGANGAGKTSLLRMVAGLVRVSAGNIALVGGDAELGVGEQAHYLGHLDALKPALTVAENIDFWASFQGDGASEVTGALDAVALSALAGLPAGYLSAGQRRRLSIARLVAARRPIWLLDEPTAALDAPAQARLVALMQAHLAGGGLILAATHGPLGIAAAHELRIG